MGLVPGRGSQKFGVVELVLRRVDWDDFGCSIFLKRVPGRDDFPERPQPHQLPCEPAAFLTRNHGRPDQLSVAVPCGKLPRSDAPLVLAEVQKPASFRRLDKFALLKRLTVAYAQFVGLGLRILVGMRRIDPMGGFQFKGVTVQARMRVALSHVNGVAFGACANHKKRFSLASNL